MRLLQHDDSAVYLAGGGGIGLSHPTDCHIYLVDGGGELALIDAGSGIQPGHILKNIEQDGLSPSRIRQILITHSHWDHARGCAWWQKKTGAEIHGHPLACETVDRAGWQHSHVARRGFFFRARHHASSARRGRKNPGGPAGTPGGLYTWA